MAVLARQRQQAILRQLVDRGAVRVGELAARYGVSDMTIRRDLDTLAARGQAEKVHGGAVTPGTRRSEEPGFVAKSQQQPAEKEVIARAAAQLVVPGSAIAVGAGTTTAAFAEQLLGIAELTVVTNSVPVSELFYRGGRADQTVLLTGGTRTPSDALVGPMAVASLRGLHLDQAFLGAHGMSASGFTTPNLIESDTNRALIATSGTLIVLADGTKWNVFGLATFASLGETTVVVTDGNLPDEGREVLQEQVAQVVEAGAAVAERAS